MTRPSIAIVASHTSTEMTQGKILGLAPMLQQYGYDPVILTWDQKAAATLQQKPVPYQMLYLQSMDFDRLAEAKKLYPLLDRKLHNTEHSPTWGDLLVFDDFLGAAQLFRIDGMGTFRPDLIITAYGGAESSTPEDEQMNLALYRFAMANKIPTLGLEVQQLDCMLDICRWPVDLLLRKDVTNHTNEKSLRLSALHRYFTQFHMDPIIEDILMKEKGLREQLQWEPGIHYLFLPFHLYYMHECYELLEYLGKAAKQLEEKNVHLLIGTGSAFRRGLKEKDIVFEGGKRFYEKIPKFHVIEGGQTLAWCYLSEAVLIPYPHAVIKESCHKTGVPMLNKGSWQQWNQMEFTVTLPEAVAWGLGRKGE